MNNHSAKRRIGFIGILVNEPEKSYNTLNDILHQHASIIVGRLGIPYQERNLSIISLVVDGDNDEIGALTGKIGQLSGVTVKSAFAKL
ncbi:CopG family transcriptional regulator [candidate division KSB1 bacterium 4572_119]|nr:MAG: CopG family transcriptional regulator [candidate division KSB1 bacterium 4572_119]